MSSTRHSMHSTGLIQPIDFYSIGLLYCTQAAFQNAISVRDSLQVPQDIICTGCGYVDNTDLTYLHYVSLV